MINAHHLMRQQGAELVNISLHYGSNYGIDMIYRFGNGSIGVAQSLAAVEAKNGHSRDRGRSLPMDSEGGVQGSPEYNQARLDRYIAEGDGSHSAMAEELLRLAKLGKLNSYASFAKDATLWKLEPDPDDRSKFTAKKVK